MLDFKLRKLFLLMLSLNLLTLCAPSAAWGALGATRKAIFSSSGFNTILNGLKDAQKSNCMITVTNISSTAQTIAVYAVARYALTGAAIVFTTAHLGTNWMPGNVVNAAFATVQSAVSITAGETRVYYIDYPPMPAGSSGNQTVSCEGYITAQDTDSTAPGFVLATGTLSTFAENGSAVIKIEGGTGLMRGSATYSQIPISIGEGRPF